MNWLFLKKDNLLLNKVERIEKKLINLEDVISELISNKAKEIEDKLNNLEDDISEQISNKAKEIEDKLINLENAVSELGINYKQMSRLQYKYSQEIEKLITVFEQRLADQSRINELEKYIYSYRDIINNNVETLIEIIDEFDLIRQGLDEDRNNWNQVLEKWTDTLLKLIKKQDTFEIDLLGKQFDPRLAEAVSTVSQNEIECDDIYSNHDIVRVLKRGYKNIEDYVIRKASVITFKEESNEQDTIQTDCRY
jgi:molecular chaperone GrpE (heat shock protein)